MLPRRLLTFHERIQEISDALAGQMSNQDEDEVEDELERMENEANANAVSLPEIPSQYLKGELTDATKNDVTDRLMPDVPSSVALEGSERLQKQKERAKARKVALHA